MMSDTQLCCVGVHVMWQFTGRGLFCLFVCLLFYFLLLFLFFKSKSEKVESFVFVFVCFQNEYAGCFRFVCVCARARV